MNTLMRPLAVVASAVILVGTLVPSISYAQNPPPATSDQTAEEPAGQGQTTTAEGGIAGSEAGLLADSTLMSVGMGAAIAGIAATIVSNSSDDAEDEEQPPVVPPVNPPVTPPTTTTPTTTTGG